MLFGVANSCKSSKKNTKSNTGIVEHFINSYNKKDSTSTFKVLHPEFKEYWYYQPIIHSKKKYARNYSWGKQMNDFEEIKIIRDVQDTLEVISTYYSDRDKMLNVSPYKSKKIYVLKDYKIFKIIGQKFEGYEEYDTPRRETYDKFFNWLSEKYNQDASDFFFSKNGAKKLKKKIIEYKKESNISD